MEKAIQAIIEIISKMPGDSLGIMPEDSPFVRPILARFPETRLHLYSHDTSSKPDLPAKCLSRVTIINTTSDLPKYLTPISPLRDFYDYGVIGQKGKLIMRHEQNIWPRINIGGVLIQSNTEFGHDENTIEIRYKKKWVIVMGCCRGATEYISKVIGKTKALRIQHQRYGRDGIVGGEATGILAPKNSIIIHQVRNPLGVIAASSIWADRYTEFCESFIGYRFIGNQLLWGMNYWYHWNLIAEQKACWTYRVENLSSVWNEFCQYLRISECDMPDVPKNVNSKKVKMSTIYPCITWDTLDELDHELTNKIKDLTVRYGYNIASTDSSLNDIPIK